VNFKTTALVLGGVLVGAVAGASLGPALTQVSAQSGKFTYHGRDMRLKTPRIPPLDPKNFTPEQKAAAIAGGSAEGANANFRTALNNPDLGKHWWDWLRFVHDNPGTRAKAGDAIPQIDKELVVMRISFLFNDDWLWATHVPMAKAWGRSEEEVARIAKGPDAPGWNEKDRALVRSADELHAQGFIADETWNTLTKYYNTRQMLDIIFLAGVYTTNAYFNNSVGMPFTEGYHVNGGEVKYQALPPAR
jgi:alkylhydroperoxidase family enzyme